jgi:hypothetical protein
VEIKLEKKVLFEILLLRLLTELKRTGERCQWAWHVQGKTSKAN